MNRLNQLIGEVLPVVTELRHELHACPETGYEEHRTAETILRHLRAINGLAIRSGVAGTGIVATLNADRVGPCVALRADMDALTMQEESGLPYASRIAGRMHACGHDGHMACLVGTAMVLSRLAEELPGKVKFIFQPAEEGGAGGAAMCEQGALADPQVDAIFALHGWPDVDLGKVEFSPGPTMASADRWEMKIHGKGCHAAMPHKGVDPVVVAAQVITAWQTIAARTIDPLDAVVLTAARISASTASNIIADRAELEGTIRALRPEVRARLIERMRGIAEHVAAAFEARAELTIHEGYPMTINDPKCTALFAEVARSVLGADHISSEARPSMGGEDFSYFVNRVPGVYWRLGVRVPGVANPPALHQPTYDFPDAALPIGIRLHGALVQRYLGSTRP